MTLLALGLVLSSAFAHATWNYLAKRSRDPAAFTWAFVCASSAIYLPIAVYVAHLHPVPPEGWVFAVGTMLLHVVYFRLLAAAYSKTDLSIAYPVARGTGIALVPVVAVLALGERVSPGGAISIAVILAGVLVAHTRGEGRAAVAGLARTIAQPGSRYALLTGVVIAAYSVWDKQGVALVHPLTYGVFPFLGPALFGIPLALGRRRAIRREIQSAPGPILAAGVLSPLAYVLVLVALTFSQVSYVAAAREVGIVVGTVLGALVLKEAHSRNRLLGSAIIVLGVLALGLVA